MSVLPVRNWQAFDAETASGKFGIAVPVEVSPCGQLDFSSNADMMSDMKTFTVRELDRSPSTMLDACDRDGEARIRRRDGRTYLVTPATQPRKVITGLPDFAARARKIFPKPLTVKQTRLVDRAIRGE